jgi:hypothetical protein
MDGGEPAHAPRTASFREAHDPAARPADPMPLVRKCFRPHGRAPRPLPTSPTTARAYGSSSNLAALRCGPQAGLNGHVLIKDAGPCHPSPKTVSISTTNDSRPTTAMQKVATVLNTGLFFAAPSTLDRLARMST